MKSMHQVQFLFLIYITIYAEFKCVKLPCDVNITIQNIILTSNFAERSTSVHNVIYLLFTLYKYKEERSES